MLNKYEKINEDRYQRFVFTLSQCGKFLLDSTDEIIETYIFEKFPSGNVRDTHEMGRDRMVLVGVV